MLEDRVEHGIEDAVFGRAAAAGFHGAHLHRPARGMSTT
jgi:hypothetical protein